MKVTITLKPGSKFQERLMKESLELLLTALKQHYSQTHKKNEIKIEYDYDDIHDKKS